MVEVFVWRRGREIGAITFLAIPPRDSRDVLGCLPQSISSKLIAQIVAGWPAGKILDYFWRRTG